MHVGSPERGGSADEADRRFGLAEIAVADGFTRGWEVFRPSARKMLPNVP
jgi:hypothetical protein